MIMIIIVIIIIVCLTTQYARRSVAQSQGIVVISQYLQSGHLTESSGQGALVALVGSVGERRPRKYFGRGAAFH